MVSPTLAGWLTVLSQKLAGDSLRKRVPDDWLVVCFPASAESTMAEINAMKPDCDYAELTEEELIEMTEAERRRTLVQRVLKWNA